MYLRKLAEVDRFMDIKTLVVGACREFGSAAFAKELEELIASPSSPQRGLALRDAKWLMALSGDRRVDPKKPALVGKLCKLAANCFRDKNEIASRRHYYEKISVAEASLAPLLEALIHGDEKQLLSEVLRHVEQSPTVFHLNDCQVPALKSLIARSRRRYGAVPPPLAAWLASVRWRLELATRAEPTPPVDWTRPAEFKCNCRHCGQLRAFLVDPTNAVGRIAAAESSRGHLIDTIEQNRCDVKHALERKGSPYSLVLTKTNQTFDRALKQYLVDCKLLSSLPADP